MSVLSKAYFHNEAAAFEHVEAMLWPQGPVCPKCGSMDKHYKLVGVRSKASKKHPEGVERQGLYKCAACRSQFTVRMGTIFEESHLPLHKWLRAIHLMCSSKKGISSHQLHRVLECTYKTAWFLSHRIREAMRPDDFTPMGGARELETDQSEERFDAIVKKVAKPPIPHWIARYFDEKTDAEPSRIARFDAPDQDAAYKEAVRRMLPYEKVVHVDPAPAGA